MAKIAFIGLGVMGGPMAAHLAAAWATLVPGAARWGAGALAVCGGTGRQEEVEVARLGAAEPGAARLGRLVEHVDGLAPPVVARRRHRPARGLPQLVDRALLADHHAGARGGGEPGEGSAAGAGRDDVRADVAERRQAPVLGGRAEAAEPAARDVLEEDALDRLLRAEVEDLVEPRVDELRHARDGARPAGTKRARG